VARGNGGDRRGLPEGAGHRPAPVGAADRPGVRGRQTPHEEGVTGTGRPRQRTMFGSFRKHPRLGQWNGRRRSSRGEEPRLPRLWARRVLLRLAVVGLTALAVTALACRRGPPFPYRLHEAYPYDLRVRVEFQVVNPVALASRGEGDVRGAEQPVVEKY